jgi:uncharacterized protein
VLQFTEIESCWPQLPAAIEGLTILHIGDLHIRRYGRLEKCLMRAVAEPSDLLLCTGDLCHRIWLGNPIHHITGTDPAKQAKKSAFSWFWVPGLSQAREIYIRMIQNANARYGCFTTQGNHDPDKLIDALALQGVNVLANQARQITQPGGGQFNVCGLRCFGRSAVDVPAMLRELKPGLFTIAMTHYPELAEPLAAAGADLILSGHTHGGQFCFPGGKPIVTHSRTGRKYFTGLTRLNNSWLYVTRGLNGSIVPWRICCPPEIVRLTLSRGPFEKTTVTSKSFEE